MASTRAGAGAPLSSFNTNTTTAYRYNPCRYPIHAITLQRVRTSTADQHINYTVLRGELLTITVTVHATCERMWRLRGSDHRATCRLVEHPTPSSNALEPHGARWAITISRARGALAVRWLHYSPSTRNMGNVEHVETRAGTITKTMEGCKKKMKRTCSLRRRSTVKMYPYKPQKTVQDKSVGRQCRVSVAAT